MSEPGLGKVTLAELIRRAIEARLAEVRVAIPGTIQKFDAATQLAEVRPDLQELRFDESDAELSESLPVVSDVPVQFPGAGGFVITFPVQPGDPCLLVFSDRSLDKWIENGGEVDPVDLRRHHLSDAVALLGVRSKPQALSSFNADCLSLGKDGEAEDFVALAQKVHDEIDALRGKLADFWMHQHTGTVSGAVCTTTATTPPTIPAFPPAPVGSVASATVKVKG
jgi:hypothetical protein